MHYLFFGLITLVLILVGASGIGYFKLVRTIMPGCIAAYIVYWAVFAALTLFMFYSVFDFKAFSGDALIHIGRIAATLQFIIVVYSAVIFILKDIICLILKAASKKECGFVTVTGSASFTTAVLLVTLVMGIVGFIRMDSVRETDYTVHVAKSSQNTELTAAVLSDLHLGTGVLPEKLDELVDRINGMDCDVVLFVGDMIDSNTREEYAARMAQSFARIKSRYGVYFSYGNHDIGTGIDLAAYLRKAGVTVLDDKAALIGGDITLIGRRDSGAKPASAAEYGYDPSNTVIVMNHRPHGLEGLAKDGTDISISGHTHGEQFPLTIALMAATNDMTYGLKRYGEMTALTTSGTGGWGLHFALPTAREIVKLTVVFDGQ